MDIKQRSLKFYFHIMKLFAPILISLSLIGQSFAHDPATEMATAAKNFLDSLDESKKRKPPFRSQIKNGKTGISFLEVLFNPMDEWVCQ